MSATQTSNKEWWDNSYEQYKKDKESSADSLSSEFGTDNKVTSAYSANASDSKALNKVCESIYKKDTTGISFDSGEENKHKLGHNILKYCSPLGGKPTTLSGENSYQVGTIGKTQWETRKLVRAGENENKGF